MCPIRAGLVGLALSCLMIPFSFADGSNFISGAIAQRNMNWRPKGAYLTLGTALRIALVKARRRRLYPSSFVVTRFSYRCKKRNECNWSFLFVGKVVSRAEVHAMSSLTPAIVVNDRTQRVEFLPFPIPPPPFSK